MKREKKKQNSRARRAEGAGPRCGLCGKAGKLTRTDCCGNWICHDEENYVLFSYARNSCHRNHDRYTLCGAHYQEGHEGHWKDCPKCREMFETEMYVNEYNPGRGPRGTCPDCPRNRFGGHAASRVPGRHRGQARREAGLAARGVFAQGAPCTAPGHCEGSESHGQDARDAAGPAGRCAGVPGIVGGLGGHGESESVSRLAARG